MPLHRLPARLCLICLILSCLALGSVTRMGAAEPGVADTPPLSPGEQQKKFHLPPGFVIELVAAEPDVIKPINIVFDHQGRLLFTQSQEYPFAAAGDAKKTRDSVRAIAQWQPDGKGARVQTLLRDLNIPIGILPLPDSLVVYSIPNIVRATSPDTNGIFQTKTHMFGPFDVHDTHGMNNSFSRWLDGWIYAHHGFFNASTVAGTDGQPITMHSGNTYRMRADGSHIEYYCHGQVNPFGICFDPMGNVYSADCHTMPAYMLLRGAYYPSFGTPHDGLGFGPEIMSHSHGSTAIAGIVYYTANNFPKEYHDTLFIGNPVTNRINHDKLERHGSSVRAIEQPDFLSCDDPWFRPVDIKLGPDGALYVADFYNRIIGHYEVPLMHPGRDHDHGRIWRIVYRGDGKTPVATPAVGDVTQLTLPQLHEKFNDPNLDIRTAATHEVVDRFGTGSIEPTRELVASGKSTPLARVHGMWVLERLGALDDSLVTKLLADADPAVRIHVLKVLGDRPNWNNGGLDVMEAVRGKTQDADPTVRRAAADALGRHPHLDNVLPLLTLWKSTPADDTHLIHVTRMALRDQLLPPKMYDAIAAAQITAKDPEHAGKLADVTLGVTGPAAGQYCLEYLNTKPDAARSVELFHHAARNLPVKRLGELYTVALKLKGPNLGLGKDVLVTLNRSAAERGNLQLSPELLAWADALAGQLLASPGESEQTAGVELARELKIKSALPKLEAIAESSPFMNNRSGAIEACVINGGASVVPLLTEVMSRPFETNVIRIKAAQGLGALNIDPAQNALLSHLPHAPEQLANEIALSLAGSKTTAEKLLIAVQEGKVSARILQEPNIVARLQSSAVDKLGERLTKLTAGIPARDQRIRKLISQRVAAYLQKPHNADLGKQVFIKNCAACHKLGSDGHKVGPELDGVGNRGIERIAEDMLDPNRNVDQAFRSTIVRMENGTTLSGLVLRTEGKLLVLVDQQAKEQRIETDKIEEKNVSGLSPMPANFADQLPEQDLYNLLSFLMAQQKKPATQAAK